MYHVISVLVYYSNRKSLNLYYFTVIFFDIINFTANIFLHKKLSNNKSGKNMAHQFSMSLIKYMFCGRSLD